MILWPLWSTGCFAQRNGLKSYSGLCGALAALHKGMDWNHTPASVEHWLLCTKEWTENHWKDMSRHIVQNLFHPNLPHTSDLKKKGIILSVKYQGKSPQAQVLTNSKWISWVNWREPTVSTTCPPHFVELANHRQQASSHQTLSPNLRSKSVCLGWS
jgi:hypothetical protein